METRLEVGNNESPRTLAGLFYFPSFPYLAITKPIQRYDVSSNSPTKKAKGNKRNRIFHYTRRWVGNFNIYDPYRNGIIEFFTVKPMK